MVIGCPTVSGHVVIIDEEFIIEREEECSAASTLVLSVEGKRVDGIQRIDR